MQAVAVGASALAIVAALSVRRMRRWLRVVLVALLIGIACGAGVLGYRYSKEPHTLTVAAGSFDGDAPKLMTAIASRLAATNAPVRLKVVEKAAALDAADAFAKGQTDLAVVRADAGDLSNARAVMIVAHSVVLLMAPAGVESVEDLKGKTVGVVAASNNQGVITAISQQYDLERAKVRFRDLMPEDIAQAFTAKQIQALLVVMPISENTLPGCGTHCCVTRNSRCRWCRSSRPVRSRRSTAPTKVSTSRKARSEARQPFPMTI